MVSAHLPFNKQLKELKMNDLVRSKTLNNIPTQKLQNLLSTIEGGTEDQSIKNIKLNAILRYKESNIPIGYWFLKMDRDFYGDPRLLGKFNEYVKDLKESYIKGTSLCLAGSHGLGKTMTMTCILKMACQKGYSCLYTTLSDVVSALIHAPHDDKHVARKELMSVDFLVIDEFDSRYFGSENAADLYARSLEGVFRTRSQNRLPTLMATNSPNVIESFHGSLKTSIESLMSGYLEMFVVMGEDHRKYSLERLKEHYREPIEKLEKFKSLLTVSDRSKIKSEFERDRGWVENEIKLFGCWKLVPSEIKGIPDQNAFDLIFAKSSEVHNTNYGGHIRDMIDHTILRIKNGRW